jgi:hypothetical protein
MAEKGPTSKSLTDGMKMSDVLGVRLNVITTRGLGPNFFPDTQDTVFQYFHGPPGVLSAISEGGFQIHNYEKNGGT